MKVSKIRKHKSDEWVTAYASEICNGYSIVTKPAMPDVDCDFQSDRRLEVKEYMESRYNINCLQRVFSAGTFTTLKIKAAIKDIGRTFSVPVFLANKITKSIEDDKISWGDFIKLGMTDAGIRKFIATYPQLMECIRPIMNQPRSSSIHASALIVTPKDKDGKPMNCYDFTPVKKVGDMLVSEFDGYSIDDTGLLKNDCLATKDLAKTQMTIDTINRVYNKNITFEDLVRSDLDDPKVYEMLEQGYTQDVFQFGSKGMTKFLMEMHPSCIHDLIAANALYRPATIESGSTEKYVNCKLGITEPVYLWGTEEIMKDTFGLLCFQEQLSKLAVHIGGFSLAEGVKLVKFISKKKVDKIQAMKDKFMQGAEKNGCPAEDAAEIWQMIENGGSYCFNASHATAYAVTSYAGAWLKANYPTAFYTTSLEWADNDDVPNILMEMVKFSDCKVVNPDINISKDKFYTNFETDEIFWSLSRISMVGKKTVDFIMEERNNRGDFKSLSDFIYRIFEHRFIQEEDKKETEVELDENGEPIEEEDFRCPVNTRHVKHLIYSGCFDKVEGIGENITERYRLLKEAEELLQFKLKEDEIPVDEIDKPHFWSAKQVEIAGVGEDDYKKIFQTHPLRGSYKGTKYMSFEEVMDMESEGKKVVVCGFITEAEEKSYTDYKTGERKKFCKIVAQQNLDRIQIMLWSDFYGSLGKRANELKNHTFIFSGMVKYSDFDGMNVMHDYKRSQLELI